MVRKGAKNKMKDVNYCPVFGFDCPYFVEDGICECENPEEECDEFIANLDPSFAEILEEGYHIINDEIVEPEPFKVIKSTIK